MIKEGLYDFQNVSVDKDYKQDETVLQDMNISHKNKQ